MTPIIALLVVAAAIYLVFFVFFPLGRGAIYDPSSFAKTELIADTCRVTPQDKVADLGSGDGRVLIALARRGAEAHGYEINPVLVLRSRRNIRRAGVSARAFVHWQSFWRADLSSYTLVTTYQVGFIMGRLESKVMREMATGTRVVSHHWTFPTLRPERSDGDIYVYRIGDISIE
ncbi:MAG TPA: methyltransferase domain-containing protein [Spirochaetia bacterium]|nr:methyltransferase domain-containing protein [Spirochaetia bacterium]